ncbi:glycosyltransferase family protein [Calidifontibacter terrae]
MKIDLVHALPRSSSAFGQDGDGFSAAMNMIATEHDVRWLNVHPANADYRDQARHIGEGDVVLVRSDWGWYPDRLAARALVRTNRPSALLIAGSSPPPPRRQQLRYDALFFETPWYQRFIPHHPYARQAFGVDTSIMFDRGQSRDIDYLFVGRLASFKRPLRLLTKQGRRVAVGDFASAPVDVVDKLVADGVELIDHVSQEELADLYNRAHVVFVPCVLQGGGERAIVEGRACGCEVEISDDNPKLASLLAGPISSHREYARIIEGSLQDIVENRTSSISEKIRGYVEFESHIQVDKVRRLPQTIRIRRANRLNAGG